MAENLHPLTSLSLQRTQRRAHLSTLRHPPTDLLSLAAPLRPPRSPHPGRALASARKIRQPTWSAELAERVLALRKQYPCWGKDKLVVLLVRERLPVSVSMVGRILLALKRRGALHEPPQPAILLCQHRKLRKRPWAVRKPKYWPVEHPGDLVEIDTKEIRMRRGNHQLRHWERTYNCIRPHQSLAYLTPLEFITRWKLNGRKARCH